MNLGCVLHLLEDMGVPAHTRNDFLYGHYRSAYKWDWGNDLETDAETKVTANGGNSLWSGSGAVAFDKLRKYFDTDIYLGSYLEGDLPPTTWGLSEATNYQFWSLSTISSSLPKYDFPNPNMNHMDTPNSDIIESSDIGYKIYFNGVNYGVSHMGRKSYTEYYTWVHFLYQGATTAEKQRIDSTATTNDAKVFEDYENITIPRTINYTTGLANYFFRGSIKVSVGCPQGCNPSTLAANYSMKITNTSKNSQQEQVLKGGAFEFYWDDASGTRTKVDNFTVYTYDEADPNTTELWNQDSVLPYDCSIRAAAAFTLPTGKSCTDIKNYVVVYKGSINDFENPDDADSDDPNAIACWVKSGNISAPPTSYTLLVTEWGGTDGYSQCAQYLKQIYDDENPDGYILAKTPDSSCFDCRWRITDYHTCLPGSPYCPSGCNITQIMLFRSASTDSVDVIITPFPKAYCGFGPVCSGSYKRTFNKQPDESYDDFWERIFNGGVFGDGSEADCTEDGCKIPALGTWTNSWVRVIWIPNY